MAKSKELVVEIYKITEKFPSNEVYWLTSQIRRASISISSNIAEWYWRNWKWEYRHFLSIAKWSSLEVENQLIIYERLWFLGKDNFEKLNNLNTEIIKILSAIIVKLKS